MSKCNATQSMELQQQKLLNPEAPEFTPITASFYPSLISTSTTPTHPPPPPPPPPPYPYFNPYFYYQQPPPVTINYHQYNGLFVSPPPFKLSSPAQHFNLPKSHDINLPLADEDLGLITSPSSAPLLQHPTTVGKRKFRKKTLARIHRRQHFPTGDVSNSGLIWVKKNSETTSLALDYVPDHASTPLSSYPFGNFTSLMIRHIPAGLSRRELLEMLDDHCRQQNENCSANEPRSEFDFLYLPVDFTRKGNLGYAFINFTTWEGASRLYNSWKGTKWDNCIHNTKKICHIDAARFQGEALKRHFERSQFRCETDEYLPVKFNPARDGTNADVTEVTTIGTRVSMLQISN